MQTQSACLTSFVVFSGAITCNWTCVSVTFQLIDFERMIVVAQPLNTTVFTTSWRCQFAIQGRDWGDVLRLLWNVFRATGTILTKIFCSCFLHFTFLCIFWVHILFDSCHFVFYICHNWHSSFFGCWTLPWRFLFVYFSYVLVQDIILSFSATCKRKRFFFLPLWNVVFPFKAEKLYSNFEKDFEIKVCLFLALNTTKMVLKQWSKGQRCFVVVPV